MHVEGRIWNSTLVEDYADVDYVSIKSRATLGMDPELEKLQDITDDVSTVGGAVRCFGGNLDQ